MRAFGSVCYAYGLIVFCLTAFIAHNNFTFGQVTNNDASSLPVRTQAGNTVIKLTWEPPERLDVKGYRVYRTGSNQPIHDQRLLQKPEFTDIGLSNGRTYKYIVGAVLQSGEEWTGYRPVSVALGDARELSPRLGRVTTDTGVRLEVAEGLQLFKWWVVDPGQPKQVVQEQSGTNRVLNVPAGKYQVAIHPFQFGSRKLVWPERIQVEQGKFDTVKLDSGIKLILPQWMESVYAWSVVKAGQPDQIVQEYKDGAAGGRVMPLPPGDYQLAIQPFQFGSRKLVWPERIQVEQGKFHTVKLDSGIKLILPQAVGSVYAWSVVKAGQPDQTVQEYKDGVAGAAGGRVMPLPTGDYQLAIQPFQFGSRKLVWPERIQVEQGKFDTVKLDNGIKLILPQWIESVYAWSVVKAGQPDRTVQEYKDGAAGGRVMPLPPGDYQLAIQPFQFGSRKLVWPEPIQVEQGVFAEVSAASGLRLDVAKWVPSFDYQGWWGVVRAGEVPGKPLRWRTSPGALLLAPGEYDVYWKQDVHHSPMRLRSGVRVAPGQLADVSADSGLRLEGADRMPEFGYQGRWGATPAGEGSDVLVDWSGDASKPLLVPPGRYDIYWRQNSSQKVEKIKEDVNVKHKQLVEVVVGTSSASRNR